ncbi:MAG: PfkB family carbohydrate kinase [Verrucomicrobia bacterium]|jgi:fructose-1-phosphate kinase PfkB-like protein|nr:PfkB family carbohydrate kinase [Verrucomicrobiota bacterium]
MRPLILALNPSIDAEWRVDDVLWEEKNNVQSERRWAGGKGINVARWLKHLGGKPQLLLPLGGPTGAELAGYLSSEEIPARIIHLREPTRVNVIVTTNAGRQMRFNPPGPKLSRAEWSEVLQSVERYLERWGERPREPLRGRARHSVRAGFQLSRNGAHGVTRPIGLLILSGSLPRGVPVTAYARLIRLAHRFGVKTLLDCDGPAFAAAVKARPFLVKPNDHELARWWRKPLRSEAEIVCAANTLAEQTRGWVLVSRGAKRGLLLNLAEGFQATATPPRLKPRNTVGAGDALLAAVASQILLGQRPEPWLKSGLEIGSYATQCLAGQLQRGGRQR